jgi:hypothetical protein
LPVGGEAGGLVADCDVLITQADQNRRIPHFEKDFRELRHGHGFIQTRNVPGIDRKYQRMKSGGIMWTSPAIPIPIEIGEDDDGTEEHPVPWAAAGIRYTDTSGESGSHSYRTAANHFSRRLRRCPSDLDQDTSCRFESDALMKVAAK